VGLLELVTGVGHQVTVLMGDRGIPKSWRHMNGYSSHTYMWVNANGERFWVKYHFKTDQGIEFLTQETPTGSPVKTATTTDATCSTPSGAATIRPGRYGCRSCPSRKRRPTGSTRSISPKSGPTAITHCTRSGG